MAIVRTGVSTPPQKHHPLFFAKPPRPLNLKTAQAPFLGNSPLYIGLAWTPSKSRIFQWTPKILKFLILNTILSF